MVRQSDVMELRKRLNRKDCTITQMHCCVVGADKSILSTYSATFGLLDPEVYYKYLDICKSVFSKRVQNQTLDMEFESDSTMKVLLDAIMEKGSGREEYGHLYKHIIDTFRTAGPYLICVFRDNYDVIKMAKDNAKLDESEEQYSYLVCTICPIVKLKAVLEYIGESNTVEQGKKRLGVSLPSIGFVYPAFKERSADYDNVMYYTNDYKAPDHDFMCMGMGCKPIMTAYEIRAAFEKIILTVAGSKESKDEYLTKLNAKFDEIIRDGRALDSILEQREVYDICVAAGIAEDNAKWISDSYADNLKAFNPILSYIINDKALQEAVEIEKRQTIYGMMKEAIVEIERDKGETRLTAKMKNVVSKRL